MRGAFLLLVLLMSPTAGAQPSGYDFIRHQGSVVRHPKESLPWRIYVSNESHMEAVIHAIRTWNAAGYEMGYPDLFATVVNPAEADMVMDWSGRGLPPDKAAGVWWSFGPGEARITRLVVDPLHRIPEGNRAQILLQELGHCLGLGDSSEAGDVMHPLMHRRRYSNIGSARLSRRDLAAFNWLYAQPRFIPIISYRAPRGPSSQPLFGHPSGRLQIEPMVVELTRAVNVRVTLTNMTGESLSAPVVIDLWGRARGARQWNLLKSWPGIDRVPPAYRISRDYFSDLTPMFATGFELLCQARRGDDQELLAERGYP